MEDIKQSDFHRESYYVLSVVKTDPPAGIEDGSWFRYEIALGSNTMVGSRRGTLQQVTQYAHECARNMADRVVYGNRKK